MCQIGIYEILMANNITDGPDVHRSAVLGVANQQLWCPVPPVMINMTYHDATLFMTTNMTSTFIFASGGSNHR